MCDCAELEALREALARQARERPHVIVREKKTLDLDPGKLAKLVEQTRVEDTGNRGQTP